jgi:tRNA(Ile)-lysidine synthase
MMEAVGAQGMAMGERDWSDVQQIHQRFRKPPPSFILELSRGIWIEKRYDLVELGRGRLKPFPPFEVELIFPGHTFVEEIEKEIDIEEVNRDHFKDYKGSVTMTFMDCEKLKFPLRVRNFRPGDRFHPLGTKGTQKVKEFFIDHKIPKFERPKVPLIISGEMIAWIVGYRIDDRVKVTEKTKKVLKIKVL